MVFPFVVASPLWPKYQPKRGVIKVEANFFDLNAELKTIFN